MKHSFFFILFALITTVALAKTSKKECDDIHQYCNNNSMAPVTIAWAQYLECVRNSANPSPCTNEAHNVVDKWNKAVDYCNKCFGMSSPLNECSKGIWDYVQCLPPLPPLSPGDAK